MREHYPMEMVGDFWVEDLIFKGCYGDSLLYSDAHLCQLRWRGITSPCSRGRSPCHQPHPTGKSGSLQQPSSPHTGQWLLIHLQSLPRLNALAARAIPNKARDAAPTPQLQSAQTLLQPRNPPAPKSQPQTARRSLQRPAVLTSAAICLLPLLGQPDANGEIFTWKTLVWSTPLFPSAPACLMASAVQRVPSVM